VGNNWPLDDDYALKIARSVDEQNRLLQLTDPDIPGVKSLRCYRCNKNLTGSVSRKIGFGPECRRAIEAAEGWGPDMWNRFTQMKLEELHQKYRRQAR